MTSRVESDGPTARGPLSLRRACWRIVFVGLLVLILSCAIWLFGTSQPFGNCTKQRKNYEYYEILRKETSSIVKLNRRIGLNVTCVVHVTTVYQGAIAALSGVAVAIFTGTLWWVTLGMVRVAERQRLDAVRATNAATKSAEIAERALISGQRAFLSVTFQCVFNKDAESGQITGGTIIPIWTNNGEDSHVWDARPF